MTSKGLENIGNKFQVITAGGAASGGAKPQRRPPALSVQSERSVFDEPTAKPSQTLEYEETEAADDAEDSYGVDPLQKRNSPYKDSQLGYTETPLSHTDLVTSPPSSPHHSPKSHELFWLFICFIGIMFSFVAYGLLLEYTTSGGRKLHELSFLFVTSGLYTLTAAAGRYVRDETPTTIPPARFAILGLTSMGSTFCSVRSLRYVNTLSIRVQLCVRRTHKLSPFL